MENNGSVSERLSEVIDHFRLGPSEFMAKVGASKQTFYNLKEGISRPDYKTINAFLLAFPEISAEWLMRGEGAMLKEESPSLKEYEQVKRQSEVFEEMYFELKKQLVGKHETTTESLLNDEGAKEANRLLTPIHVSVFCKRALDILKGDYGFTQFPSEN